MSKMKLELLLQSVDKASPGVKKLAAEVERGNKRVTQATEQRGKAEEKAARRGMTAARRAATARQRLGVRSEHQVRREIQKTQAAYNRLARSGKSSAAEINRAYANMTQRVQRLNTELGRVSRSQKLIGRAKMTGAVVGGIAAGATAGAMMMAEPARRRMNYQDALADVANTAFSERDAKGRIAGMDVLANAVKQAVLASGGTKEQALGALDKLLASGTVDTQTAIDLVPVLQKASVATGATTEDLSKIAISAMQQFGIKKEDIGKALSMAVAAGQAGNFELTDMARWLPEQMSSATAVGMSGLDGFRGLLVANQQARVTAGSSDGAGNNVVNLLNKINSKELKDRIGKTKYTDANGKQYDGIDLLKSMEKAKKAGKNSIEAFAGIIDTIVKGDIRYKELQQKLKGAKKADQHKILKQMAKLTEGSIIGDMISDKQVLAALFGVKNNVQLGKDVNNQILGQQQETQASAIDVSHEVKAATNKYKTEQLGNAKDFAEMESMKGFNNALGDAAAKLTEYAKEYPGLTGSIAHAITVIKSLGTAAVVAASSLYFLGGGKGKLAGKATEAVTSTATTVAAGAGGATVVKNGAKAALKNGTKLAARAAPWLTMLMLGGSSDRSKETQDFYTKRRQTDIDYLARMVNSLEVYKGRLTMPDRALQYKKDLAAHPNSDLKQELTTKLDGLLQQAQTAQTEGIIAKTPELNEHINTLAAELNQRTDVTNAAIQAIAAQPIVIQQTNQVHIDGAMVSETVSRHQGNRLSRGEN